jgi:hypothetical protein
MNPRRLPNRLALLLVSTVASLSGIAPATAARAQEIPSPQEFFGFQMGADRQLARWDRMVEYYNLLAEQSPRLEVVNMGPSTMGNDFLVLFISSPENLSRLDKLRQINATLSDPRGVSQAAIEQAINDGKAVVTQSMGLHWPS